MREFQIVSAPFASGVAWPVNILMELGVKLTHYSQNYPGNHWQDEGRISKINPLAREHLQWHLPTVHSKSEFEFEPGIEVFWEHRLDFSKFANRHTLLFVRDPRDAIHSLYRRSYNSVSFDDYLDNPADWPDHFPGLFNLPPADTWAYFHAFWLGMEDLLPLTVFRFEDMRNNPVETVEEMLALFDLKRTREEINRALEASTFDKAKGVTEKLERETGKSFTTARRGKVGEWKESFTRENLQRFSGPISQVMKQLGYSIHPDSAEKVPDESSSPIGGTIAPEVQESLDLAGFAIDQGDAASAMRHVWYCTRILDNSLPATVALGAMVAALDWTVRIFGTHATTSPIGKKAFQIFLEMNRKNSDRIAVKRATVFILQRYFNGTQPISFRPIGSHKIWNCIGAWFAPATADSSVAEIVTEPDLARAVRSGILVSFESESSAAAHVIALAGAGHSPGRVPPKAIGGNASDASALKDLFRQGNYSKAASLFDADDWRVSASQGLCGSLKNPRDFPPAGASDSIEEHSLYKAAAFWIAGDESAAKEILRNLTGDHARGFLKLISKPVIQVAAQTAWTESIMRDPKFRVRFPGPRRTQPVSNIHGEVQSAAILAYPSLQAGLSDGPAVDFYFAHMAEWQILPFDLTGTPFPVFGVTSDFDIHVQCLLPWLSQFDELITVGPEEWEKVSRMSNRAVSTFPKMFGLPDGLPPVGSGDRPFDLFISGTIASPYNPDKAKLLHQLLDDASLKIRYVDGFLDDHTYFREMAKAKVVFTYVRHPGSMPSRGLEALAMGCAVLTQQGSALSLYAGEEQGVFTYDADRDNLAGRIKEIAAKWPEVEPKAKFGAALIRNQFRIERYVSQFLRFLTFLAAKPRGMRSHTGTTGLHQKRSVARRGYTFPYATNQFMVENSAKDIESVLLRGRDVATKINLVRELDLFTSVDLSDMCRKLSGDPKGDGVRDYFARMRSSVASLYGILRKQHSESLALRFNALRHAFHNGTPDEVQTAMQDGVLMLEKKIETWELQPLDDVYPWDYQSQFFNYRRYFDTIVAGQGAGNTDIALLRSLILASVCSYMGLYTADIPVLRRAVELDPEFPFYRLHLARALALEPSDRNRLESAALAIELGRTSMVLPSAYRLLEKLGETRGSLLPGMEEVNRKMEHLRKITESSSASSLEFENFKLVLPPSLHRLPLESD